MVKRGERKAVLSIVTLGVMVAFVGFAPFAAAVDPPGQVCGGIVDAGCYECIDETGSTPTEPKCNEWRYCLVFGRLLGCHGVYSE